MNEKVKQALYPCLWIGNASLRVMRSEKWADERETGSLWEWVWGTLCSYRDLGPEWNKSWFCSLAVLIFSTVFDYGGLWMMSILRTRLLALSHWRTREDYCVQMVELHSMNNSSSTCTIMWHVQYFSFHLAAQFSVEFKFFLYCSCIKYFIRKIAK